MYETILNMVGLLIGIALYDLAKQYWIKRKERKPLAFDLFNHTYLNQNLKLNKTELKVLDFDQKGTYVDVLRKSDRQKFRITRLNQ